MHTNGPEPPSLSDIPGAVRDGRCVQSRKAGHTRIITDARRDLVWRCCWRSASCGPLVIIMMTKLLTLPTVVLLLAYRRFYESDLQSTRRSREEASSWATFKDCISPRCPSFPRLVAEAHFGPFMLLGLCLLLLLSITLLAKLEVAI